MARKEIGGELIEFEEYYISFFYNWKLHIIMEMKLPEKMRWIIIVIKDHK